MDMDDHGPLKGNDPLAALTRQDLATLSVEELDSRIAALESEIARTRDRREFAVNHRANAESLFRR